MSFDDVIIFGVSIDMSLVPVIGSFSFFDPACAGIIGIGYGRPVVCLSFPLLYGLPV